MKEGPLTISFFFFLSPYPKLLLFLHSLLPLCFQNPTTCHPSPSTSHLFSLSRQSSSPPSTELHASPSSLLWLSSSSRSPSLLVLSLDRPASTTLTSLLCWRISSSQRVQLITEGWTGPHHPCLFLDHSPPTPLTELHHLSSRLSLVEQHHQHHRSWFESRSVHPFTLSISLWSWSSSPPWKQLSTSAPLNHRLHLPLLASSPYLLWLLLLGSGLCRVGEATFPSPASISSGRLLFNSELSGLLCSC